MGLGLGVGEAGGERGRSGFGVVSRDGPSITVRRCRNGNYRQDSQQRLFLPKRVGGMIISLLLIIQAHIE